MIPHFRLCYFSLSFVLLSGEPVKEFSSPSSRNINIEMNTQNPFSEVISCDNAENLAQKFFQRFCSSKDQALFFDNFQALVSKLFVKSDGSSYSVKLEDEKEMFDSFDLNQDGMIDQGEFETMWSSFVLPMTKPRSALIVIDVQNDFIDGSLAIRNCPAGHEAKEVVPVINNLLKNVSFDKVFYTFDWHPENHISFIDNVHLRKVSTDSPVTAEQAKVFDTVLFEGSPPMEQKLWPRHCVQNSWGAELNPDLLVNDDKNFVYKGINPDVDSYSAFWDNQKISQTDLHERLKFSGITDLFISGLALDYCVGFTALHALEYNYKTILVEDATRGVATKEMDNMKENLVSKGAIIVVSNEVQQFMLGKDRRPELGLFLAKVFRDRENV